jgi:transposase-like protein
MPKLSADAVAVLPDRTRLRWKREEAHAVVAAYEASGLSVEKFAARQGLKPARLGRWMRKLKVGMPPKAAKFVELRPVGDPRRNTPIQIVLRSGDVLFVAESVDPTALRRVMELLERDGEC